MFCTVHCTSIPHSLESRNIYGVYHVHFSCIFIHLITFFKINCFSSFFPSGFYHQALSRKCGFHIANVVFLFMCHAYTVHLHSHMFGQVRHTLEKVFFFYMLFIISIQCCVGLNALEHANIFHMGIPSKKIQKTNMFPKTLEVVQAGAVTPYCKSAGYHPQNVTNIVSPLGINESCCEMTIWNTYLERFSFYVVWLCFSSTLLCLFFFFPNRRNMSL